MCAINDPLHKLILLVLLLLSFFNRHFGFVFFFFHIKAHCSLLTHVRGPVSLILKLEIHDSRYVFRYDTMPEIKLRICYYRIWLEFWVALLKWAPLLGSTNTLHSMMGRLVVIYICVSE